MDLPESVGKLNGVIERAACEVRASLQTWCNELRLFELEQSLCLSESKFGRLTAMELDLPHNRSPRSVLLDLVVEFDRLSLQSAAADSLSRSLGVLPLPYFSNTVFRVKREIRALVYSSTTWIR